MALKDVNIKLLELQEMSTLAQEMTVENTGELLEINKSTNSLFAAFFKQLAVEAGDRKEAMDELAKGLKGGGAKSEEKKVDKVIEKAKKGIFPSLILGNFLEQIGISALLQNLPAIGLFLKQIGKATPTYILGNLVFKTMVKTVKALRTPLNLYLKSLKAIGKFFRLDAFFKGAKAMGGFYGGLLKGIVSKISPFNLKDIKGFGTFLKNVVLKPFEVVSDAVKVGLGTGKVLTGASAVSAVAGGSAKAIGPKQAKITQALGTIIENVAIRFMLMKDAVAKFFKPLTSLFGGGGGTQSKGMMKVVGAIGGFLKGFGRMAASILKFVPIIGWIFVAFDAIKGLFAGFAKYKDEGIVMGIIGAFYGGIEQVLVGAIGIPFDMITKAVSWLLSKIPGGKFLSDKIDGFLEGGGFTGLIRGFFGGLMDMIGNFFASFFSGFENGMGAGLATMMLKMAKFMKKLSSFPIALIAGGVAALANILGKPKEAFMKTFKKVMNAGDSQIDSAIVAVGGKTKEQAVADRMKKKEEDLAKKQLEIKKKEIEAREKELSEGATETAPMIVSDSSTSNSGNTTINNSGSSGGGGGSSGVFTPTIDTFDRNSGWGFA
jgi:hypothetical protein